MKQPKEDLVRSRLQAVAFHKKGEMTDSRWIYLFTLLKTTNQFPINKSLSQIQLDSNSIRVIEARKLIMSDDMK